MTIRIAISNWMYYSLLEDDLNSIKLYHQSYAYFCPEQKICILDRPTLIKVLLDSINLEARVNIRNLKDKLR